MCEGHQQIRISDGPRRYRPGTSAVMPDAVTVVDVDVTAVVIDTGLLPDGSPPAAEAVAATAGRLANSPVPVLSTMHRRSNSRGMIEQHVFILLAHATGGGVT